MKHLVVGPKGASVSFLDRDSGEVLLDIPLSQGVYPLAFFARFGLPGAQIAAPTAFVSPRGNMETVKPRGQYESAANPSFRVSPAQRQLREMQRMMTRTSAWEKRLAKAAQAMKRAKAAVPQIEHQPSVDVPPVSDAGEVPAS